MKLTSEEKLQASADRALALWRKYRQQVFDEHGHVPLSPFGTYQDSWEEETIICACGETLCQQNGTIQARMQKFREDQEERKKRAQGGSDGGSQKSLS